MAMNKVRYIITTPYGNRYELTGEGYVIKYSNGLDKTNGEFNDIKTWQVLGIVELKPFGNIGELIPLNEAVKIKSFTFKNGNPKYTGVDLDHGTKRIWMNTTYHGVNSVYEVK